MLTLLLNRRPHGPPKPAYRGHVRAHEAVIENEYWYGDGAPQFGEAFSAEKTAERQAILVDILQRAAQRALKAGDTELAEAYYKLVDKQESCRPKHRCGSLGCPKCAMAFQRAKVAAQQIFLKDQDRPERYLVFVSVIPKGMTYYLGQFSNIDIPKANRWLKDVLKRAGITRLILGSADLGWETRRGGNYLQVHWHLALWTSNPKRLKKRLQAAFPRTRPYERTIDVTKAANLKFLPYLNKAIKLPNLLRRNRTHLPELLLTLDRTDPLDLLVLSKMRLGAQEGGLVFAVS
jgi:hypothetical protein